MECYSEQIVAIFVDGELAEDEARRLLLRQERDGRGCDQESEQDEAGGAPERRQHHPQAGPGQRQKQAQRRQDRGNRRPEPLPEQAAAGARERTGKVHVHGPAIARLVVETIQSGLRRLPSNDSRSTR